MQFGIYTLGGGRQIGKTTLLKQWMEKLLQDKINPLNIYFITGELFTNYLKLTEMLREILGEAERESYIIIDEVTYINDWDKAIKFLADAGLLEKTVLILSGSDLLLMQEARSRFPGRRGKSDVVDFHLYPLSFTQVVNLKLRYEKQDHSELLLQKYFDEYLMHGGFLTAINDFTKNKNISIATIKTYSDWILGDMEKRGKQETYLKEIFNGIIKRYSSSLSWNAIAKDLSIDHPSTVANYIHLLKRLDVLLITEALLEDKLVGAPKKGKKLFFQDPFIYHAINFWLNHENQLPIEMINQTLSDPEKCSTIVEGVVTSHFNRITPTFYLKGEGEVDVAYIKNKKIFPIEVSWKKKLNIKDLKQLKKYSKGRLWGKKFITTGEYIQEFLPMALYELKDGHAKL